MTPAFDNRPAIPTWLLLSAAATMLIGSYLLFVWVSTEVTMGIIQRIFYFHVPAATAAFCAVFGRSGKPALFVEEGGSL